MKAKIFQKLDNIYIFLLPHIKLVLDLVPFLARSPNRFFSRTKSYSRRLSSSIPVYLIILGPRASSDCLLLILSNPVYHSPNSVSVLHCLAQNRRATVSFAQPERDPRLIWQPPLAISPLYIYRHLLQSHNLSSASPDPNCVGASIPSRHR
jgi:hypothetical protein